MRDACPQKDFLVFFTPRWRTEKYLTMNESNFTNGTYFESTLSMAGPTSLPAVGLALVLVLGGYLAFKTYMELKQENVLKQALYDETGIDGKYEFKMPEDERAAHSQLKAYLLFLKANGKPPTQGAKLEMTMEKAKDILRNKLDDEERKRMKLALVKWMIGTIEVLARVERDRPGAARLYEKKLVSEEYWDGVQECFRETHETIQEINAEAGFLEEGLESQIFTQALQLWRLTKFREQQRSGENSASSTPPPKD
jgi:hypothetical protein